MRYARAALTLATLSALIVVGASAAHAGSGAVQWGLTVSPGTDGKPATVYTPSVLLDYGLKPPTLVSVTPFLHMMSGPASPTNTYPTCSAFLYRNGAQWGAQSVGPDTPAPYAWDLDLTPPITWKVVMNCPLPQGATGNPDVDATLTSELPKPTPSPSPTPSPVPLPAKPVAKVIAPSPKPVPPTPKPAPTESPAVSPVAAVLTPSPSSVHPAPSPVAVASPAPSPSPPAFEAAPRSAVTVPGRGFHLTFLELLAVGLLVLTFLAARWHWGWR